MYKMRDMQDFVRYPPFRVLACERLTRFVGEVAISLMWPMRIVPIKSFVSIAMTAGDLCQPLILLAQLILLEAALVHLLYA